jgi:hypothetical protein
MKILFTETQGYKGSHIFIFVMLIGMASFVPLGIGIYQQLVIGKPWGDNPMSDTGLIITSVLVFILITGILLLFIYITLIVEVTNEGIRYKYIPLINKWKLIAQQDIHKYTIRNYRPVMEYGGHGIRTGKGKYGVAYSVSGKTGLQLELKSGKKILFGTKRPEPLIRAMNRMMEDHL